VTSRNELSDELSERRARLAGKVTSRRTFFAATGAGVGLLALAACTSEDPIADSTTTTAKRSTTTTAAPSTTAPKENVDLATANLAAGLEVLAVQTYDAALAAATAGSLGAVPPAAAEYVTTAKAHHEAALSAWNGVITSSGGTAVTEPDPTLKPTVDAEFAKVTDVNGAVALALMLEEIAAATYQKAIPTLTSTDAIELAGSIQIVDAQHVAILLFVSGQYPVPETFASTDKAAA